MDLTFEDIKQSINYLISKEGGEKWTLDAKTPEYLKKHSFYVSKALEIDIARGAHMSEELKNDKKFALEIVAKNGLALQYFAPALLSDAEVCTSAIYNNYKSIEFAVELSKDTISDLLILGNVHYIINSIMRLKKKFEEDAKMGKPMTKSFMSASEIEKFFDDKDLVRRIIRADYKWVQYASERLHSDIDIFKAVIAAIRGE